MKIGERKKHRAHYKMLHLSLVKYTVLKGHFTHDTVKKNDYVYPRIQQALPVIN